MLRALRQPRYAALSVLMVIVASVCVAAGTWQIARLHSKAVANSQLRHNAHAPTVAVAAVLPLVGSGHKPAAHAVQFREVTATGNYEGDHTALVRNRQVNGDTGFLIVTPLRTATGTLLVVRGFVSASGTAAIPTPPPPPSGQVTITARVQPAETRNDRASTLADHQVESINAAQQATRLTGPVFDGYVEALDGQPGVGHLIAIPKPDLSNPAGGAIEPQHLAYIIQWYLFALLALAAPIAMVRAETRERSTADFDTEPAPSAPDGPAEPSPEQTRAAKLADRYGRAVR